MRMRTFLPVLACSMVVAISWGEAEVEPTSSAEIAAQHEIVRSAGDERSVNVTEELSTFLSENEGLVGSSASQSVSFAQALATARRLASEVADPAAIAALRAKLPPGDNGATLRLLAAREALAGKPDAAFCLLVAALDADPQNADLLCDLAGMLASLGYVNEALAVLDELQRRGAVITPPLGLATEDVLDYTRGYCALRLGDTDKARPLLESVARRQPLLAEAPRLLALLDAHENKDPRRNFLQGVWRQRGKVAVAAGVDIAEDEPDPAVEDESREEDLVAVDVRSLVNLSKGKPGILPNVPYAKTPESANAYRSVLDAKEDAEEATRRSFTEQRNQATPSRYRHTDTAIEDVWGARMENLVITLDYRDAKLRDLDRAVRQTWAEMDRVHRKLIARRDDGWKEAYDRVALARLNANQPPPSRQETRQIVRPFFESALSDGLGVAEKHEAAVRNWFAEWHLLATAVAANVGDSSWREVIRLRIEHERSSYYARLLHNADKHAVLGRNAILEIQPGEELESTAAQGMENCDGNQSVGLSVNSLGAGEVVPFDLGVEMTCEGLSVEAGVSVLPGLQLSGEVGVDTKGGYSVFVGPKIDATLKGTGSTVKTGFVVSGSRGAGPTDFGAKMETKLSVSAGAVSRSTKVSDLSMSFLPAPKSGPPADLVPLPR